MLTDETETNRMHTPTIRYVPLSLASAMIRQAARLEAAGNNERSADLHWDGAGAAREVKRNPETIPNLSHVTCTHVGPRASEGARERVGQPAPRADIVNIIAKCTLLSNKWYTLSVARAIMAEKSRKMHYQK